MLETLGVIEIPPQCLQDGFFNRQLGGCSVLQKFVRQVTESELLDGVVVAVGSTELEQRVAALVPADVPVFIGSDDVLKRYAQIADEYPTKAIVRICVDHLFVDPAIIDRLISTAEVNPDCDYVSFCSQDGRPTVLSSLGLFAEWIRVTSLRKAERRAKSKPDRQIPTRYIYSHPEKFELRLLPVPESLDRDDVRLTVAGEEDWENMEQIYEALGEDSGEWQRIAGLLEEQPQMRERMAKLNRVGHQ